MLVKAVDRQCILDEDKPYLPNDVDNSGGDVDAALMLTSMVIVAIAASAVKLMDGGSPKQRLACRSDQCQSADLEEPKPAGNIVAVLESQGANRRAGCWCSRGDLGEQRSAGTAASMDCSEIDAVGLRLLSGVVSPALQAPEVAGETVWPIWTDCGSAACPECR